MGAYMKRLAFACLLAAVLVGLLGIAAAKQVAFADDASLQVGAIATVDDQASKKTLPKHGWEKSGGAWHYWRNGQMVKSDWVNTIVPPRGTKKGDTGVHRYWIDAKGDLAMNRLIDPKKAKDKGAYYAYATKYGYVATGKCKVFNGSTAKIYLGKKKGARIGELETGNKYGILTTTAYDRGVQRAYYINPKTHSVVVKSNIKKAVPVKVKGFGWVYPCYKGGFLLTGRKAVGNRVYLARSNGKLETGDSHGLLSSKRYSPDGSRQRYYINPKTHSVIYGKPQHVKGFGDVYARSKLGSLVRGVTKIDGKHVILAEQSGKIYNKGGWYVSKKYTGGLQRYWMEPTSKNKKVYGARIGYFKVHGNLFLGLDQGYVLRNEWHNYKGKYYSVDNEGVFNYDYVVSRLIDLAQGYWSPSQYLIMVDIDDPQVVVFEGSMWNWSVLYVMDCCTGTPATPTPEGTFAIGDRGYSFGESEGFSCYYWTQYYGPYYFHTRMYYPGEWVLMDERIGRERVSHGCIRLYDEDAYWIWTQVPSGTTVGCVY